MIPPVGKVDENHLSKEHKVKNLFYCHFMSHIRSALKTLMFEQKQF